MPYIVPHWPEYLYCIGTVASRYYDTAGIRKKYVNIQAIEISSINF